MGKPLLKTSLKLMQKKIKKLKVKQIGHLKKDAYTKVSLEETIQPEEMKSTRFIISRWKWIFLLFLLGIVLISYSLYSIRSHPVFQDQTASILSNLTESNGKNWRIRYKHTNRRLPQCIIIGIRKAGTRALLKFLNLHPDVITAKDEIHFFDRAENLKLGYDWYRRQMPYSFPDQITIEKSPSYFHELVAKEVYQFNSSIRLLLIVRDPVNRTISDYLQLCLKKLKRNRTCQPFEQQALRDHGQINFSYQPIKRSLYADYIKHWYRYFQKHQILVIDGDKFKDNPYTDLYKVETFLGLAHKISENAFYLNESKGFYCYKTENQSKCLNESKGRPHPPQPAELIWKLRNFFFNPNREFFNIVGKDFGWNNYFINYNFK